MDFVKFAECFCYRKKQLHIFDVFGVVCAGKMHKFRRRHDFHRNYMKIQLLICVRTFIIKKIV